VLLEVQQQVEGGHCTAGEEVAGHPVRGVLVLQPWECKTAGAEGV
jgi:hypothetical protein